MLAVTTGKQLDLGWSHLLWVPLRFVVGICPAVHWIDGFGFHAPTAVTTARAATAVTAASAATAATATASATAGTAATTAIAGTAHTATTASTATSTHRRHNSQAFHFEPTVNPSVGKLSVVNEQFARAGPRFNSC